MGPDPFEPGAFLGVFCGREWACRLAEARGCWAVLHLDDNIRRLDCFAGTGPSGEVVTRRGGLALHIDILAAVTLATNAVMTGAKLQSVNPAREAHVFARAGFPYSLFVERTDLPEREPWYGPIEDDIMHAYQIGVNARPDTACLVQPITYMKDHGRQDSGMRPHYDQRRSVALQRLAPEMARLSVHKTHSNGRGGPRVFHSMLPGSIRTPLAVTDELLWAQVRGLVQELALEVAAAIRSAVPVRLAQRASGAG